MADDDLGLPLSGGQERGPNFRCRRCKQLRTLDQLEKKGTGRRPALCKECRNAHARREYAIKPERREYLRKWDAANPEKKRGYSRESVQRARYDLRRTLLKMLSVLRGRCKDKTECTIGLEELLAVYEAQQGRCVLTGAELAWGTQTGRTKGRGLNPDAMSFDRIDQDCGYVSGNVRLITFQANGARSMWSDERLYAFCEAVLATRAARVNSI